MIGVALLGSLRLLSIFALHALVDPIFKQYDKPNVPGCALGVYRNGAIAYARGYGMADLERNVRITPESVFDVGSISKQFAAAAIDLLVQDGKLAYTDDVRKYVPQLPVYGKPITLNELMWHTSGLRDYTDLLSFAGYGLEQVTTDDNALSLIVRQRHLEFPSGTRYEYSNTNYFLLSVIVKRVTGQTLAQFVRQRIFMPLGMNHTLYRTDYAMLVSDRAMGYRTAPSGGFENSMSNWQQTGDGGVQLSIDDAAKWDENFYRPRVGGRRMVDDLQTPGRLTNGKPLHYGRGLFIGSYRGLREISHGGAWIGYRGEFDRYPAVHTSVVIFCNSDAARPAMLAQRVAGVVLKPYLSAPARIAAATERASMKYTAKAFTGAYFDQAGGDVFHVVAHGNGIALDAGGAPYPLVPSGGSTFRSGSMTIAFVMGTGGRATALHLNAGDDVIDARKFTPASPSAAQLRGAAGTYSSPELDVTWDLRATGATLILEPSRVVPQELAGALHPIVPDTFASDGGFIIRFVRNSSGAITGFDLGAGSGLRSLLFTRATR